MGVVSVLIAGIAGYVFGAVWYGLLGRYWREAANLTEEEVRPADNASAYLLGILCNVLVAGMMRHVFVTSGVEGPIAGLVSGLGLGAFIAGSYLLLNYSFARRSGALKVIDIGHAAGSAAMIGLALGIQS